MCKQLPVLQIGLSVLVPVPFACLHHSVQPGQHSWLKRRFQTTGLGSVGLIYIFGFWQARGADLSTWQLLDARHTGNA